MSAQSARLRKTISSARGLAPARAAAVPFSVEHFRGALASLRSARAAALEGDDRVATGESEEHGVPAHIASDLDEPPDPGIERCNPAAIRGRIRG